MIPPTCDWNGHGCLTCRIEDVGDRRALPPADGAWRRIPAGVRFVCGPHALTHWRVNEDGTVQLRAAGG